MATAALYQLERLEPRVLLTGTAAAMDLDPTFGSGGFAAPFPPEPTPGTDGVFQNLTPAPHGKVYAVVYAQDPELLGERPWFDLIRIRSDGSLDPTFGSGGAVHVRFPIPANPSAVNASAAPEDGSLSVDAVIVQPDGKVLVETSVANRADYNEYGYLLSRFNADGSPDASFGEAGTDFFPFVTDSLINPGSYRYRPNDPTVTFQSDGRINLFTAAQTTPGDVVWLRLQRLNADGTPDETFAPGGERIVSTNINLGPPLNDVAWGSYLDAVVPLPDGTTVAYVSCGDANAFGDVAPIRQRIDQVRFDTSGNVISSALIYQADDADRNVAVQTDGKALLWGTYVGTATTSAITRIGLDGLIDTSFGVDGTAQVALADGLDYGLTSVVQQLNGTILVSLAPGWDPVGGGFEVLNADGSPDTAVAGGELVVSGRALTSIGNAVTLANGSILVQVYPNYYGDFAAPFILARLLPDGGIPDTVDLKHPPTDPGNSGGGTSSDGTTDPGATAQPSGEMDGSAANAATDPAAYYQLAGGVSGSAAPAAVSGLFDSDAIGVLGQIDSSNVLGE